MPSDSPSNEFDNVPHRSTVAEALAPRPAGGGAERGREPDPVGPEYRWQVLTAAQADSLLSQLRDYCDKGDGACPDDGDGVHSIGCGCETSDVLS